MFESDDWILENAFNNIDEEAIYSQSQCQNDGKISSTKRRKIDGCEASSLPMNNTLGSKLDTVENKDDNNLCSNKSVRSSSREKLLLEIFQENTSRKISNCSKETNNSTLHSSRKMQHSQLLKRSTLSKDKNSINKVKRKEVKFIRLFPGPAGLVSPIKGSDVSDALDITKESEDRIATECIETNLFKSQDEKNLFGERAWKLLLNDLPNNFLNEHGISIIKSRANTSFCSSTRVKFIAGLLDHIDHSHEDPFFVLKDSTGSIEGTIHRDIPSSYPGLLEPNVVLLLHDVGLLKTTTCITTNKYHILVSRANLLAIYSNKGRILQTSCTENILSSMSNIELTRDLCVASVTKPDMISGNLNEQKDLDDEIVDKIFESFEPVNIHGDMNDIFFTTDSDFVISDEPKYLDSSLSEIPQSSRIQRCESQSRNNNCLRNAKKESTINLENKLKEPDVQRCIAIETNDTRSKSNKICTVRSVLRENSLLSHSDATQKTYGNPNSNLKSASLVAKCNAQNSKSLASYFSGKTLHDNEYDSDDEILSQLDIDNVLSN